MRGEPDTLALLPSGPPLTGIRVYAGRPPETTATVGPRDSPWAERFFRLFRQYSGTLQLTHNVIEIDCH